MSSLRLLMTADTVGGVFTYAVELARALGSRAEVHLATMGALPSPAQRAALAGVCLHPSSYRLEWMSEPWQDVARAGRWLLDLEREIRPDVVHLNGYAHGALGFSAPVLLAAHSCVASWFDQVVGTAPPASFARYLGAVRRGLLGVDRVVAPTRVMLGWLRRFYGPLPPSRVIANGCRSIAPFAEGRPLEKQPLVLSAGRLWDRAKNLRALQAAAPGSIWPICVAGAERSPDAGAEPVPSGTGAAACHDLVHHLGQLPPEELGRWMARAAVFVAPVRYEPFGLSILEAALAGCALVLGDVPTLREVWGDAACFVSPDDPEELSGVIAELARRPGWLAERQAAARQRAQLYCPLGMALAYLDEYDSLLKQRHDSQRRAACGS